MSRNSLTSTRRTRAVWGPPGHRHAPPPVLFSLPRVPCQHHESTEDDPNRPALPLGHLPRSDTCAADARGLTPNRAHTFAADACRLLPAHDFRRPPWPPC